MSIGSSILQALIRAARLICRGTALSRGCCGRSSHIAGQTDSHASAIQSGSSEVYYFARRVSYAFLNVFAIKMAGVFLFSTCTIALRTAIFPRWIAFTGFVCGVTLLLVISNWLWIALLFPLWIALVSAYILVAERGQHR